MVIVWEVWVYFCTELNSSVYISSGAGDAWCPQAHTFSSMLQVKELKEKIRKMGLFMAQSLMPSYKWKKWEEKTDGVRPAKKENMRIS